MKMFFLLLTRDVSLLCWFTRGEVIIKGGMRCVDHPQCKVATDFFVSFFFFGVFFFYGFDLSHGIHHILGNEKRDLSPPEGHPKRYKVGPLPVINGVITLINGLIIG